MGRRPVRLTSALPDRPDPLESGGGVIKPLLESAEQHGGAADLAAKCSDTTGTSFGRMAHTWTRVCDTGCLLCSTGTVALFNLCRQPLTQETAIRCSSPACQPYRCGGTFNGSVSTSGCGRSGACAKKGHAVLCTKSVLKCFISGLIESAFFSTWYLQQHRPGHEQVKQATSKRTACSCFPSMAHNVLETECMSRKQAHSRASQPAPANRTRRPSAA